MLQHKRLARALVITGVIMVTLLTIAINRGPLMEGFRPYHRDPERPSAFCLWCADDTPPSASDYLGTTLIILLILLIPIGHIAVIILVVQQLHHGAGSRREATLPPCPYCERPIHRGWKACPSCGNRLEHPKPESSP